MGGERTPGAILQGDVGESSRLEGKAAGEGYKQSAIPTSGEASREYDSEMCEA
ncbi:hypothetical protein DIPPA_07691 [Diplonema papillatum]|nr:hypothetical protein DIPPA_07691 [Diplonema papillatum]